MDIWEIIETFLERPSGWKFINSSGFNFSCAFGIGHENLIIERHGIRARLRYDSLQGGFSVLGSSVGGSVSSMPSAEGLNKIYIHPMFRKPDLDISDFEGGARSVFIGASVGLGINYGMYVFGSGALAVSLLTAGAPPLSLITALGLAYAIGFLDASSYGDPNAGITFGMGAVDAALRPSATWKPPKPI